MDGLELLSRSDSTIVGDLNKRYWYDHSHSFYLLEYSLYYEHVDIFDQGAICVGQTSHVSINILFNLW